MSENIVGKTNFKDPVLLKKALIDLGVEEEWIGVYDTPVQLSGGDRRKNTAHIVVKGGHGSYHDIGFKMEDDGTYSSIVYDADARTGLGKKVMGGQLAQQYLKAVALKAVRKYYGHKIESCQNVGNKIEIMIDVM